MAILLTSTSDLIRVTTSSASALDIHASFMDASGGTVTPGRTNTAISSATTTTVVSSPASSTQRNVKTLTLRNKGTSYLAVTVQHTDGTTPIQLMSIGIPPDYQLLYDEGDGWVLIDPNGNRTLGQSVIGGRYIQTTVLTGSGTFTTSAATNVLRVRAIGGGGGGGGCTSVAAAAAGAGGGGAGTYSERTFPVPPSASFSYVCGSAGVGQSAGAGTGGTGTIFGNTAISIVTSRVAATQGNGAAARAATTTLTIGTPGGANSGNSGSDIPFGGSPGKYGLSLIIATPVVFGGRGASSPFGGGGPGTTTPGDGHSATGYGAGGGGGCTGASAAVKGGDGTPGCIVVDEFT